MPVNDKENERMDEQRSDGSDEGNVRRVLILGSAGELGGEKLTTWYEDCEAKGVQVFASDVVAESKITNSFTGFTDYFDLSNASHRDKLFDLGRRQRFDLTYDATWPDAHLLNIPNWDAITKSTVVTKPFVSIEQYHALKALVHLRGFGSLLEKVMLHDHYINKPGMQALFKGLPAAHAKFGKFSRMMIVITERRTVNDEGHRKITLEGGMIPDLASHAVMILQLLTPVGLVWPEGQSGRFVKRLKRKICPTACVRSQMIMAAVDQDVDTACVIEYRVVEKLCLVDEKGTVKGAPFHNKFFVLVVCGKGLCAGENGRDLKAVEIAFQGQGGATGVVDLDTNRLNDVLTSVPGIKQPLRELRANRGLNLPLEEVLEGWNKFEDYQQRLFQNPKLIWENMSLLYDTRELCNSGILPAYPRSQQFHNFVNANVGPENGFEYFGGRGSGWPMKHTPMHLMLGQVITPLIW